MLRLEVKFRNLSHQNLANMLKTKETQLETPLSHYKLKKIECDEPIRSISKIPIGSPAISQLIEEA